MTVVQRWIIQDLQASPTESWTMPMNPREMTSPIQDRAFETAYGVKAWGTGEGGLNRLRTVESSTPALEWSFTGFIRDKAHYDQLAYWARKDGKVRITDHLGRTFEVLMQAWLPTDRKPTPNSPWRLQYQMKTLLLRRIA
jgi:hypothetical protein